MTTTGNDYRTLAVALTMDANRNRTAVAFDALGMIVGTAAMGKPEDTPRRGDLLDGFAADLEVAVIQSQFANEECRRPRPYRAVEARRVMRGQPHDICRSVRQSGCVTEAAKRRAKPELALCPRNKLSAELDSGRRSWKTQRPMPLRPPAICEAPQSNWMCVV